MSLAAIDRLVHHATIFGMTSKVTGGAPHRSGAPGPGVPAAYTTPKVLEAIRDHQDENG